MVHSGIRVRKLSAANSPPFEKGGTGGILLCHSIVCLALPRGGLPKIPLHPPFPKGDLNIDLRPQHEPAHPEIPGRTLLKGEATAIEHQLPLAHSPDTKRGDAVTGRRLLAKACRYRLAYQRELLHDQLQVMRARGEPGRLLRALLRPLRGAMGKRAPI
jgi:hypothetical protein